MEFIFTNYATAFVDELLRRAGGKGFEHCIRETLCSALVLGLGLHDLEAGDLEGPADEIGTWLKLAGFALDH